MKRKWNWKFCWDNSTVTETEKYYTTWITLTKLSYFRAFSLESVSFDNRHWLTWEWLCASHTSTLIWLTTTLCDFKLETMYGKIFEHNNVKVIKVKSQKTTRIHRPSPCRDETRSYRLRSRSNFRIWRLGVGCECMPDLENIPGNLKVKVKVNSR